MNGVLENPQYCLFVDKCGINMNQKDRGNHNQRLYKDYKCEL